jgi:GrpB-like predicted nucleotidyltransferase (UPF0157 family)
VSNFVPNPTRAISRRLASIVTSWSLTVGDPEIERMLLFRDRLRRHPDDRSPYECAKWELAGRRWACVRDCADAKSSVVEGIIDRARADRGTI